MGGKMTLDYYVPFSRPFYVMAKPVGSLCNLACKYCYYLETAKLYEHLPQSERFTMSDRTLEEFIRQYLEAQTQPQVLFTWHGGEPLLRPLSFYKRAMELQRKYARGRIIDNCLQTNGTLLTDEWCEFFHANNWLIGISIDGPQHMHDEFRRTRGGQPTFTKVMQGLRLLQKHGVEWNAMGTVNDCNVNHPLEVYHFYKENGCKYIQFAPVVETRTRPGYFFCSIFDEWVRNDVGQVFVQLFDSTLACWVGAEPGVCTMCETCGHVSVLEANGDLYSCDHFVFPEHLLGNIHHDTITSMVYSEQQRSFGLNKRDGLPPQCHTCQWLFACNGGCPKDRFCYTSDGYPGLNFLCQDFQQFFTHVAPYMDFMKNELLHHRPPANVMQWTPPLR